MIINISDKFSYRIFCLYLHGEPIYKKGFP